MSMPMLLTALDTTNGGAGVLQQLDEHHKSCASYVDAAAVIVPQFNATVGGGGGGSPITAEPLEADIAPKVPCTPTLRKFTLLLDTPLEPFEYVGLTGDAKALGEWQLERSVALNALDEQQWAVSVLLHACRNIQYRYFVYTLDGQGRKQIRRWETALQPRTVPACSEGHCELTDRFGKWLTEDGGCFTQVNRGWLTNDTIVQLKFERQQLFQVLDIDAFDPWDVLIKLVPLQEDLETPLEPASGSGVNVEVVKFQYGQSQLQAQSMYGTTHRRGDVLIFHVTVPHPLTQSFALIFHTLNTGEYKALGKVLILAEQLTGCEGELHLSIMSPVAESERIVARLTLPYTVVRPFVEAPLDFRTTYAHHWPKSWPNLDVGHRGNGRSYLANAPSERENTLASFRRAYEMHADMVEFDVHLTTDGVPIIYHDFGVRTAPQSKKITNVDQLQYVLIKDLTYAALKDLRVFAVINNEPVEYPSHNKEANVEHRIFPTLVDVLVGLPKSLGMDVEIKWPQKRAGGNFEAPQMLDKNKFVDRVIATIIKHGCGRPLIFSSFDADICTMLRFKQNIFPVMFLTMGETKKWEQFIDLRTRNVEQAINNAQAFELAGTAPHAEDFLDRTIGTQLIQKARDMGQIAIIWGDDCNAKERVEYFTEIGATATCYDRTDLYIRDGKERAFFNSSALLAEFEDQCRM